MIAEEQVVIVRRCFTHVKRAARIEELPKLHWWKSWSFRMNLHHKKIWKGNLSCPPNPMILYAWNCQGLNRSSTACILRVQVYSHHSFVLFLSETKMTSNAKFSRLMSSLHFDNFHFVLAIGKAGRITLCWKNSVNIQFIVANDCFINVLVLFWSLISTLATHWVRGPTTLTS